MCVKAMWLDRGIVGNGTAGLASGRLKGHMVPPGQGPTGATAPAFGLLCFLSVLCVRVRTVGNLGQPVMVEGSLKDGWRK